MVEIMGVKFLHQVAAGIIGDIVVKGVFGSGPEGDFVIESLCEDGSFLACYFRIREALPISL